MRRFAPEKTMARSRYSGYGKGKENTETLGTWTWIIRVFFVVTWIRFTLKGVTASSPI
jgi:hypothetical protein